MRQEDEVLNLLDLIGQTIERLRRSVDLFEAARRTEGRDELSLAVREIESYLERMDGDRLLPSGGPRRAALVRTLGEVKAELLVVIRARSAGPSASHE